MKKLLSGLLTVVFVLLIPLNVLAETVSGPRVLDNAGLLSTEEVASLEQEISRIADAYQTDFVILTVQSLDGKTPEAYADDYYDANGYGYGVSHDGLLFLLAMDTRDWHVSTTGSAIDTFFTSRISYVVDQMLPDLSAAQYGSAFATFLSVSEEYLFSAANTTSSDNSASQGTGNEVNGNTNNNLTTTPTATNYLQGIGGALIISAIIAGIYIRILAKKMKTRKAQSSAAQYFVQNSFRLSRNEDIYLNSSTSRTALPKNDDSGSSSFHGGSSTHTGSSGTTHGGSGGKF